MSGLISLNDLRTKFFSAGQYTVIVDNSITDNQEAVGITRLVAGFSKAGNWNAPFYIDKGNTKLAKDLYGDIDPLLERNKSYFQRSILNSLEEGGVLALNLLKTVDEVDEYGVPTENADVVNYMSYSLNPNEKNGVKTSKLYASFYNKERFWSPSPEYLIATRSVGDRGKLFNIVNLGQKKISIITRKTSAVGYNQKARDWYGGLDKVPAFVDPNTPMREYFVDVYVLAGDFTDFNRLKNDVKFGQFFTESGLIVNKFNEFINDSSVTVLNLYTGAIIPNVKDINGNNLSIDVAINKQTSLTGLLASLDYGEFDKIENGTSSTYVDLVGSSIVDASPASVDFLSYRGHVNENAIYDGVQSVEGTIQATGSDITITEQIGKTTISISSASPDFEKANNFIKIGSAVFGVITSDGIDYGNLTTGKAMLYVTRIQKSTSAFVFEVSSDEKKLEKQGSGSFVSLDMDSGYITFLESRNHFTISKDNLGYSIGVDNPIYEDWKMGRLRDGSVLKTSTTELYVKFEDGKLSDEIDGFAYGEKSLYAVPYVDESFSTPATVAPTFGSTFNAYGYNVQGNNICFINEKDAIQERFDYSGAISPSKIYYIEDEVDNSNFADYVVGDYVVGYVEDEKVLSEITAIYKDIVGGNNVIVIEASSDIYVEDGKYFYTQKQIEDMFDVYNIHCLEGFTLKDRHQPNGTNERMKEIYSVMTDSNIRKALVDPDFVTFRYFIDTFNHGIEPQSKRYLTMMLRDRQQCLGILNAPSADELKKSQDPRFTNSPTPVDPLPTFDTKYLVTGGNLAERPKRTYSLPTNADGVSFAGWFFPNLIIDENGTEVSVPPASYVGNAFMRKWNGGSYGEAVAGLSRGTLTGDGLSRTEIPLDKFERGDVKRAGMNPIYKKGNLVMIYGNNTGLTEHSSILQHLHARDTLIQAEIDIQNILSTYEFSKGVFSDDIMRTMIETSLYNYLENQRDTLGNFSSFTLKIDVTNNPAWVVENGAMIIDIGVTIPEVTDRFISRLTLNRASAGVSVGAFTSV